MELLTLPYPAGETLPLHDDMLIPALSPLSSSDDDDSSLPGVLALDHNEAPWTWPQQPKPQWDPVMWAHPAAAADDAPPPPLWLGPAGKADFVDVEHPLAGTGRAVPPPHAAFLRCCVHF